MKPALAALSFFLALSPAFAQNAAVSPCSDPDHFGGRDRAWIAAFDDIDARFKTIPDKKKEEFRKNLLDASNPNTRCAASAGLEYDRCGVFVDHLVLDAKGLFKIEGRTRWYNGDRESPNLESTEAAASGDDAPFNRICAMRAEREKARAARSAGAGAPDVHDRTAEQLAASKKTLAMIHTFDQSVGVPGDSPAAPAPSGSTMYQSAKSAYRDVADAANQAVEELTPEIISNNVGQRCGSSPDPDCGCRVWRTKCAGNPALPACRSTVASMCPGLQ